MAAVRKIDGAFYQLQAFAPLDEFSFHKALSGQTGAALVLFSSPDCGTCRRVECLLPELAAGRVALFRVDVQQSTALARQYEIFHLPALRLFVDGRYHAQIDCELTPTRFAKALQSALNGPAEEEP